jgi:flagellar basal-body rod protein FlgB
MFQGIFRSTTIPVLEQLVQFTQARHEVLAGNIANLGTPGYAARDLSVADFQVRLQDAIEARRQPPGAMPTLAPGAMPTLAVGMSGASPGQPGAMPGAMPTLAVGTSGAEQPDPVAEVAKDPRSILFHDQSDNAAELQVTEMVKNQLQHNTAMAILGSQFRLLQTVISERV